MYQRRWHDQKSTAVTVPIFFYFLLQQKVCCKIFVVTIYLKFRLKVKCQSLINATFDFYSIFSKFMSGDLQSASLEEGANEPRTVPMVLISMQQRTALIEYLAKQPYEDVASGIEFLRDAPSVNVTLNVSDNTDISSVTEE